MVCSIVFVFPYTVPLNLSCCSGEAGLRLVIFCLSFTGLGICLGKMFCLIFDRGRGRGIGREGGWELALEGGRKRKGRHRKEGGKGRVEGRGREEGRRRRG